MKKVLIVGIVMVLLCFLVACGNDNKGAAVQEEKEDLIIMKEPKQTPKDNGVSNTEIEKSIKTLYDFTVQDFNITVMDIIKRKTDIEEKTDVVYVHVEAENDDFKIVRNYQLIYELYNEGWMLEESNAYVKDEYYDETIPLHGVDLEVVKSDFAKETAYENIGEKWFYKSYYSSIYYDIEHTYSDVFTDCYEQEIELIYDYFTRKTRVSISYNLEGYNWTPTVLMEHEYYLNDAINGSWELYIEAGHPMAVDSTISVNLNNVDNTNCYCGFRWTSRIAGGHDDVFEGTYSVAARYDDYGDMMYILLAHDNLYGNIQLTPTGVLYEPELSNSNYSLIKK